MSRQIAAGAVVTGIHGPIAHVRNVALSPVSLQATWLVVDITDAEHVTAVPTASASLDQDGTIRVPFTRAQLLAAPAVETVVGEQLGLELRRALGLA